MNHFNATALDLIQDALEGVRCDYGVEPRKAVPEGVVVVPFAVMGWDDGLDMDGDGNFWQDSPPSSFIISAHETLEAAESSLAERNAICPDGQHWIEENHWAADYEVENASKWG